MTENNNNTRRSRFILVLLAIVVIIGIWFLFLRDNGVGANDASDILVGEWLRTDGVYKIEITDILEEGIMTAAYFNPNPIHIGRAGWKVKEGELLIYVELQDENYPGSLYELSYDEQKDRLRGTYYQAVTKQTFNVEFKKK